MLSKQITDDPYELNVVVYQESQGGVEQTVTKQKVTLTRFLLKEGKQIVNLFFPVGNTK